jgi:hypothetical protein
MKIGRGSFPSLWLAAVAESIGEDRAAIRAGPWAAMYCERRISYGSCTWCCYKLTSPIGTRVDDPIPTFSYLAHKIKEFYPHFPILNAAEIEHPRDGKESKDLIRSMHYIYHKRGCMGKSARWILYTGVSILGILGCKECEE